MIFSAYDRLEVIAPNFKRRLSGVTSTIMQLIPAQAQMGLGIATLGPGLPSDLPKLRYRDLWRLWKRPKTSKYRIWHARRNLEMLVGIIMRDLLRMPLKLVFTSAAQRGHTDYTKLLIDRMDHVIATSEKSGRFLGVPHDVIYHGVDTNRFVPPTCKTDVKASLGLDPSKKVIGCTGRIRPSKGTDIFVDAMVSLLPENPNWIAVITGRTTSEHVTFKEQLETQIASSGLQDRIRFVGEVEEILHWYQAFDLFVAPSRNEGFGLTPLEAMACGVPCVTSDAGVYPDIIRQGKTGYVVAPFAAEALTQRINSLINTPDLLEQMGALAGQTTSEKFPLETEAINLIECYRKISE
ncbi:MAG: glycosyltransferase family 4 protein [Pseudomonadota bacterium]